MAVEIVSDWTEGIDWSSVADPTGTGRPPKCDVHGHPSKWDGHEIHDLIDLYAGEGPDGAGVTLDSEEIYHINHGGDQLSGQIDPAEEFPWPWTELSELHEDLEDRDPEELGVVSIPSWENGQGEHEHIQALFSTLPFLAPDADTQLELLQAVIDEDEYHEPQSNGGLVAITHPNRYYNNPVPEWDRYVEAFDTLSLEDGLFGIEALNKNSPWEADFGARGTKLPDKKLWDKLLTRYMPARPVWSFATNDTDSFRIGRDFDLHFTWLLLDDSEFDPSDQAGSREAAADAFQDGRMLTIQRERWDAAIESPPELPVIDEIDVDHGENTITIDATGYDEITWISRGLQVGTGSTLEISEEHIPYVRAELSTTDPKTLVLTNPWGLKGDKPIARIAADGTRIDTETFKTATYNNNNE